MGSQSTTSSVAVILAVVAGLTGCGGEDAAGPSGPPGTVVTSGSPIAPSTPAGPRATTSPPPTTTPPRPAGQLVFTGTTLDGKSFDAATLAGKPVLLWFWAPWCPICKGQAPDVRGVHKEYAGRVSVVGVAGLDDRPNMKPFVDATQTGAITHLADPDGSIWQRFKVTEQSTYVLIDASGNVTFSGKAGGDELRAKVAELAG